MKRFVICLSALALFISISFNVDADLARDLRLADAETLIGLFAHRYGPREWKREYLNLSFEQISERLRYEAATATDDRVFYEAMNRFITSLSDVHVRFSIPSSLESSLGFAADDIGGEIVIDRIDRMRLPENSFPFRRGDRLVSINGVDAKVLRENLSQFRSLGHRKAEDRMLASYLTYRQQKSFIYVPSGMAEVSIYSRERARTETLIIPWQIEGYDLAPVSPSGAVFSRSETKSQNSGLAASAPQDPFERLRTSVLGDDDISAFQMGNALPSFDMWDTFVERTRFPLYSGVIILSGRRIGFLRINSWSGMNAFAMIPFLENEIPYFEENTDALIIDQTYNPGGSVCLEENVVSFFVDRPVPATLFEVRANRQWLVEFESVLSSPGLSDEEKAIIEQIVRKFRETLAAGRFSTDPLPICSADGTIRPHVARNGNMITYTKPILLLVNEMDASCGDLFPAQMQDIGRAVLFGSRTMGAGGNVVDVGPLGFSDFSVRITESLMWRTQEITAPNGIRTHYIENVGVLPDVPYEIGLDDYLNGYNGYRAAIGLTVENLLRNTR